MTQVEVSQDGFVVDAEVIAQAFDIKPERVLPLMRGGEIKSRSETGMEEDAGLVRLTFYYDDRAVRLVVDQTGNILKRVRFPTRSRKLTDAEPLPVSGGRPLKNIE